MNPSASETIQPRAQCEEIVEALHRLDALLEKALAAFDANHGGAVSDRFRGLYISASDARGLLHADTGALRLRSLAARLARLYGLEQFELDALLIAFAPEFDLRYERLYAYLQDDVSRKRPTVDLVLNLLCASDSARLERRTAFASDSALLGNAVVRLVSDPHYVHPPLLAQYVTPDEQIVRFLLGDGGLDSRLAASCRVVQPNATLSELAVPAETMEHLVRIAREAPASATVACLWFHGPRGVGKGEAAEAMAHEAETTLLVFDANRVDLADLESTLPLALREAWFRQAFLYIERTEYWLREPQGAALLASALRAPTCTTIVGSTDPLPAAVLGSARPFAFPVPGAVQRAECWRKALAARTVKLEEETVAALSSRFRLTPAQISSAVSDALQRSGGRVGTEDFAAAARAQSGQALASLADKVEPQATWDDIVLPPDALAQLRELCERVDHHNRVFNDWGFARKLSRGRGATALFSGGSGTGKTMAAEVIANALGLDLYKIDLSRVVNKYIGETEKNLDRIFCAAEDANAILFFDEADALFGKRSEVHDSHDRYANLEISYLLQKMEHYEGIAILATNLRQNLDDAFVRRLAFTVHFPFPDEADRQRIWSGIWPAAAPLAEDIDLKFYARQFKLSGGNIKNIALASTFIAAADGGVVTMEHLRHATQREYQKLGKALSAAELYGNARAGHV